MKKVLSVLFVFTLMISISACGNKKTGLTDAQLQTANESQFESALEEKVNELNQSLAESVSAEEATTENQGAQADVYTDLETRFGLTSIPRPRDGFTLKELAFDVSEKGMDKKTGEMSDEFDHQYEDFTLEPDSYSDYYDSFGECLKENFPVNDGSRYFWDSNKKKMLRYVRNYDYDNGGGYELSLWNGKVIELEGDITVGDRGDGYYIVIITLTDGQNVAIKDYHDTSPLKLKFFPDFQFETGQHIKMEVFYDSNSGVGDLGGAFTDLASSNVKIQDYNDGALVGGAITNITVE